MTDEEILRHLRKKLELNLWELATAKKHCEHLESLIEGVRADIAMVEARVE